MTKVMVVALKKVKAVAMKHVLMVVLKHVDLEQFVSMLGSWWMLPWELVEIVRLRAQTKLSKMLSVTCCTGTS